MTSNGVMAGLAGLTTLALGSFHPLHRAKAEVRVRVLAIPESGAPFLGRSDSDTDRESAPALFARVPGHHLQGLGPGEEIVQNEEGIWDLPLDALLLDVSAAMASSPGTEDSDESATSPNDELFPESIRRLDGERVRIRGFIEPIEFDVESDRLVSFAVSRFNDGCGFGGGFGFDGWVRVEAPPGEPAEYTPYTPVTVTGTFAVGEEFDEFGYLSSLYRLQADTIELPW